MPVIVVGNLTIGGTGKTPMVHYLADYLYHYLNFKLVVVMRGYRSKNNFTSCLVPKNADPRIFGDEPVMLANILNCPVVIGKDRVKAVKFAVEKYQPDLIICDDGLQHYALARDLEILMIDGARYFGNSHHLPLGPLRESLNRLNTVDFIIIKQAVIKKSRSSKFNRSNTNLDPKNLKHIQNVKSKLYHLILKPEKIYNLKTQEVIEDPNYFELVHAVSGIGNNLRFFESLHYLGIKTIDHPFPDHYVYKASDLNFHDDLPIIMTEKDAIKCRTFAKGNFWYLKIIPEIDCEQDFHKQLKNLL